LDRLAPGTLTLRLDSPDLESIGSAPRLTAIEVPGISDATVSVPIPSARALVVAKCGARGIDWGDGLLRGRVGVEGSGPVTVVWQTPFTRLGAGDPVVVEERRVVAPGSDGTFEVCGVPRDAAISLRREGAAGGGIAARFAAGALAAFVVVP
jgi:hypothetical protein